jgi:hypothetical protein
MNRSAMGRTQWDYARNIHREGVGRNTANDYRGKGRHLTSGNSESGIRSPGEPRLRKRRNCMRGIRAVLGVMILSTIGAGTGFAALCPTGQIEVQPGVCIIDGAAVPKYVTPLVIPPGWSMTSWR